MFTFVVSGMALSWMMLFLLLCTRSWQPHVPGYHGILILISSRSSMAMSRMRAGVKQDVGGENADLDLKTTSGEGMGA